MAQLYLVCCVWTGSGRDTPPLAITLVSGHVLERLSMCMRDRELCTKYALAVRSWFYYRDFAHVRTKIQLYRVYIVRLDVSTVGAWYCIHTNPGTVTQRTAPDRARGIYIPGECFIA